MKTSLLFSVLFLLLILAITPAQSLAAFYSGSDLVALMPEWDKMYAKARGVDLEKAYIFGAYITGVCDGTESQYSIPPGANKGQIIAVVSKYLKTHPEQRGDSAASLVIKALGEAFPRKSQ